MDEDKFIDWLTLNAEELMYKFLDDRKLREDFEWFCQEEYANYECGNE